MGNRAVVLFDDQPFGVYLHWNGGPESVLAFLEAANGEKPADLVGFVQTVANFFGYEQEQLSLYVEPIARLDMDNGDNGTYHVKAGKITHRSHTREEWGPSRKACTVAELYRGSRQYHQKVLESCLGFSEALLAHRLAEE